MRTYQNINLIEGKNKKNQMNVNILMKIHIVLDSNFDHQESWKNNANIPIVSKKKKTVEIEVFQPIFQGFEKIIILYLCLKPYNVFIL